MSKELIMRQIKRKKRRDRDRKFKRIRNITLGLIAVVSLSFFISTNLPNSSSVNADTAKIIENNDKAQASKFEKADPKVSQDQTYTDKLQAYKKVGQEASVYSSQSVDSKVLLNLTPGEYVKFYGSQGGWAKVSYKTLQGYVNRNSLIDLEEKQLKVVDGTLLVSKQYTVPEDFKTAFDVDTESAMMVMLESARREGIELSVGNRYLDSDSDFFSKSKSLENNSDLAVPDASNSELRTGLAIEILAADARVNVDFTNSKEFEWLKSNSYKYGFVLRYPESKVDITGFLGNDHIYRYVGVDLAKDMYQKQATFEEYFK